MTGGAVNIPLKDGKSINIPVDRITYNPKTHQVQISEEMSKTAIWKQLAANESDPNFMKGEEGLRHRLVLLPSILFPQCKFRDTIILKPIFHQKTGLRWVPDANEIDINNMKCTCPTPAPTPEDPTPPIFH